MSVSYRTDRLHGVTLDPFVPDSGGDVTAYGLFWFDQITSVGLVEPMRTEHDHAGRGLARHVLTTGSTGWST